MKCAECTFLHRYPSPNILSQIVGPRCVHLTWLHCTRSRLNREVYIYGKLKGSEYLYITFILIQVSKAYYQKIYVTCMFNLCIKHPSKPLSPAVSTGAKCSTERDESRCKTQENHSTCSLALALSESSVPKLSEP